MVLLLGLALTSGCGGGNTEVWLAIGQDGTFPCLGASHMELQVITTQGVQVFHEFNPFFNYETHACMVGQYRHPDLPLGSGIQIAVSMWDSTGDASGQLSSGASMSLDLKEGSPTTQLDITLSRTSAPLGTIIVQDSPADWNSLNGVDRLEFIVTPDGATIPKRSGLIAWAREIQPSPFPLIISGLPIDADLTSHTMTVTAKRGDESLATWNGSAWLGPNAGQNPAFANLQ